MWKWFEKFLDANIGANQVGVLIAWNGVGCDLHWLYKVAQAPYLSLNFPSKVKYFLDPLAVLRTYSWCRLHKKDSKFQSYSLGSVNEYMMWNVLDGAQDSFVDVKVQTQDLYHLPIALNQSVQLTKCNMKFDISRWLTITHSSLIHWYRNLSIHRYISYTMSDWITHLEWCVMSILERISKFAKKCEKVRNFAQSMVFSMLCISW